MISRQAMTMSEFAIGDVVYHPHTGKKLTVERLGWLDVVETAWFQLNEATREHELKRQTFRAEDLRHALAEDFSDRDILKG